MTGLWTTGSLLLTIVLLASASTAATSSEGDLEGVVWVLTKYGAAGTGAAEQRAPLPDTRIDIAFDRGRVTGSSGCNSYGGSYVVEGDALGVGPLVSTRKACLPPVMQQEDEFQRILGAVERATITGETLTLSGPSGTLVFASEGKPTIVGTWHMESYNNGKQAVVSKKTDTTVTTTWDADGRVSGSSGCNTFSGAYTSDGTTLAMGRLASTRKMCADADVMTQEQLFLEALEAATKIELRGDRLWLRNASGATQASFRRQR